MKFDANSLVHRVLLKPFIETETKSGIVIARDERSQAINTDRGEILMFGFRAWKDYGCEVPPVKVGDKVIYAKYGAKTLKDDETGEFYILCNDEDILVRYE